MQKKEKLILWFDEISIKDILLVGGKNASLGEMYRKLTTNGMRVPNGFALTATAYRHFLNSAGIDAEVHRRLKNLNTKDIKELRRVGKKVREIIMAAKFPPEIIQAVKEAYDKLSREYGQNAVDVAVRSSATAEDLPSASFAGQQETYLNVRGEKGLLNATKKCVASLFTDRAISYRTDWGFSHFDVALSVCVQKMIRSDKASSGVAFTIDTESGFRDVVIINGAWGLGENIVKGKINPDEYIYFKKTSAIVSKHLGSKAYKLVYGRDGVHATKNIKTSLAERRSFCLSDKEIEELAVTAMKIESYYKKPMDIEWAKDGRDNKMYIVQARPETVEARKESYIIEEYKLERKSKVLIEGQSVGAKIGSGEVSVVKNVKEMSRFKPGKVLVTRMTDPDWEPIMKMASAIVTDSGGRTCHAAIVSRELGIPCVVGTKKSTNILKNKQKVTVSCAEGEDGYVYSGELPFKLVKHNLKNFKKPKMKIMLNIGNPENAFNVSRLPNDGVGLAREEFIISNYIKIHPLALLNFDKVKDKTERNLILELTAGYKSKKEFYVEQLAHGIGRIGAAFYPKDVIVRFSDFKSNEYKNLIGGKFFEPDEDNPMIGFRGASRYYSKQFKPAFALECEAIKRVREKMGLTNVKVMVPFCRTIEEAKKVLKIMADNGLKSGKQGLEVYVMIEIPSNVISAYEFAKLFDGFSIGSNDLTQLTLGVDRDSALVANVYDERDQAVKDLISQVIKIARETNTKIGICGQAPSDFPDFAKFLVKEKIDSISLNPDTVIKTMLYLSKVR